jgi:hypothetical protein
VSQAVVQEEVVQKEYSCSMKNVLRAPEMPTGGHCTAVPTCTVTRMLPLMVLGGCDRMARWVGPPPRPTVPPRPWNSVSLMSYSYKAMQQWPISH